MLEDTEDCNDISGQWYNEWVLNTWVDSPIFRWLRQTFRPMPANEPAEYPKHDEDDPLGVALLPEQESHQNALPGAPPPPKEVWFCPLPGQFCHLKGWRMKYFADHVDIFHMYAKMGNDKCTEMQLEFLVSHNPSVFIMTPKVGVTGLNLTAPNIAEITQKFWVLNEKQQAFLRVVRQGQTRVPHTWLINTGPGGYDNHTSDLHQHSGVPRMKVLHGMMNRPNIIMSMTYGILDYYEDHTQRLTEDEDTFYSDEQLS